ncbi:hypothetical protein SAMN05880574_10383 [Chryseobacterium sp. RU37D]|uniref:hypothetical protein n=1 Tax=Chryseobacterium sp. RU37D TaxID=1907397 RepID=UPI0009558D67|nr:hypothetical protein [Chryseobacterium sp. RU37D]SIP97510.1 hypothetical protein SAMN05880574_10383 [Chryseobacterium sp. RU37D]
MKPKLLLIIFYALINLGCVHQLKTENPRNESITLQKSPKIERIEITERTRGTNRSTVYAPFSKITLDNGQKTTENISTAQWKEIAKQAGLINLSKMPSFPSPTTGRFSDRALISTLIITSEGKTYTSSSFDAGIPPKELEGLYILLKGKTE